MLSLVTFLYVKHMSRAGSNKFFCHFIYFLNSQRVFFSRHYIQIGLQSYTFYLYYNVDQYIINYIINLQVNYMVVF